MLAEDEHLAAGQPRVQRPADHDDAGVGAHEARPEDGDDGQDEHDEREGDDDVDEPHHERVRAAPK